MSGEKSPIANVTANVTANVNYGLTTPLIIPKPRPDWRERWLAHPRRAMLFDLDGTLLDTAPDLAGAANVLRAEHGLPEMAVGTLRPYISQGARGMVTRGLGVAETDPRYLGLRERFLEIYSQNLARHTAFWPGMDQVVDTLDAQGVAWGIVTNKIMRFTEPLLRDMNLWERCAVVVGGDSAEFPKPHPAPMHLAMKTLGLPSEAVVYVGDDLRDIQSGYAAGTWTIACDFGHHVDEPKPGSWGADAVVMRAEELCW